jgi:hypothetical protein
MAPKKEWGWNDIKGIGFPPQEGRMEHEELSVLWHPEWPDNS